MCYLFPCQLLWNATQIYLSQMRIRGAENVSPLFTNNSNIKSDKKASLCNWLLVYCTQCSEIYNLQPRVLCKLQQRIRSEWNRHLEIRGKPREIRADTQYERLWEKGNLCQREKNKVIERNVRWNSFSSAKHRMWTSTFFFFFFYQSLFSTLWKIWW